MTTKVELQTNILDWTDSFIPTSVVLTSHPSRFVTDQQCSVELKPGAWHIAESYESRVSAPTDGRLQLTLPHLITSLKQLYLADNNSDETLLGCPPAFPVGWISSSNYPICLNHHRLPGMYRNFPAVLLSLLFSSSLCWNSASWTFSFIGWSSGLPLLVSRLL